VTDDSLAALKASLVEASKKVRHPRLPLSFFVSSKYHDTDDDAETPLAGVPAAEVEVAHMRRGSVMLAAELIIDQCIQDLQLIRFGDHGLPDPDMAEASFVYEEFPIRHRRRCWSSQPLHQTGPRAHA